MVDLDIPDQGHADLHLADHAACSLYQGQTIKDNAKALLRNMGFEVVENK